jgi:hypothetical protein
LFIRKHIIIINDRAINLLFIFSTVAVHHRGHSRCIRDAKHDHLLCFATTTSAACETASQIQKYAKGDDAKLPVLSLLFPHFTIQREGSASLIHHPLA